MFGGDGTFELARPIEWWKSVGLDRLWSLAGERAQAVPRHAISLYDWMT
jgi:hypothetical protein